MPDVHTEPATKAVSSEASKAKPRRRAAQKMRERMVQCFLVQLCGTLPSPGTQQLGSSEFLYFRDSLDPQTKVSYCPQFSWFSGKARPVAS